jgi:hypothetical protein
MNEGPHPVGQRVSGGGGWQRFCNDLETAAGDSRREGHSGNRADTTTRQEDTRWEQNV